MVFQHYALFPHMSVRENIAFGLRIARLDRRRIDREVDEMLALIQMETEAEKRPNQISGGQKQRVALARAIIMKPLLLLADELTGNLDTKTGYKVFRQLQGMSAGYSLSAVMATHKLVLAGEMNRCLTLADGKLHE